jgi:hypothetical protein
LIKSIACAYHLPVPKIARAITRAYFAGTFPKYVNLNLYPLQVLVIGTGQSAVRLLCRFYIWLARIYVVFWRRDRRVGIVVRMLWNGFRFDGHTGLVN